MKNINKKSINTLRTYFDSHIQHNPIPNLSLNGSNAFTVEIFFGVLNIGSKAALYRQEGVFELGLEEGYIYFIADGFSAFKSDAFGVRLSTNQFYIITLLYDGTNVSLYIQGHKIFTRQKIGIGASNSNHYDIGKGHDGYITTIRVMDSVLNDSEILRDIANPLLNSDNCVAWFDFSNRQPVDLSKNKLTMWLYGNRASVVNLVACTEFSGKGCCLVENNVKTAIPSYTILGKIFPFYNDTLNMCVYSNAKDDKSGGFDLFLRKTDKDNLKLIFCAGSVLIESTNVIKSDKWSDFAITISSNHITLYIDGVQDAVGTLTNSIVGRANSIIGTKYSDSRPDYSFGFSGYMDYIAEFEDVLTLEKINSLIENPPFIFDQKILSNMYMADLDTNDIVYDKPIAHVAGVKFKLAENTNPLNCEKGTSFYVPTEVDPVWATLSKEEQWELEASCKYADKDREIMYGMIGPGVSGIWTKATSTLRRRNVGAHLPENPQGVIIRGANGVAQASLTGIAGGASYLSQGSTIAGLVCGAVALIVIPTAILLVIIEETKKRPVSSKSKLEIVSLQFNHNGDATIGSIHFRNNLNSAPSSTIYTKNTTSEQINMQGVFIPRLLTSIKLKVTVKLKPDSGSPITTKLQAKELDVDKQALGDIMSNEFSISIGETKTVEIDFSIASLYRANDIAKKTNTWKWTFLNSTTGNEDFIINSNHDIYTILDTPKRPWKYFVGSYSSSEIEYVWTDVLDIYQEFMIHSMQNSVNIPDYHLLIVGYITNYLNQSPAFKYVGGSHYTDDLHKIKIQKYINDSKSITRDKFLNCTDCSNIVATLAAASGINCYTTKLTGHNLYKTTGKYEDLFYCNQIISIGCDSEATPWDYPFSTGEFRYHEVTVLEASSSILVGIYDACLKLDASDYPGKPSTVSTKISHLATNYAFTESLTPNVNVPIDVAYKKHFYRERLVENGQMCNIDYISDTPLGISNVITIESKDNNYNDSMIQNSSLIKYKETISKRFQLDILKIETKKQPVTYIPDFTLISSIKSVTLSEDIGLQKIWNLDDEEGANITIDIHNAKDIQDAYDVLLERLSKISNSNIERMDSLGDISFEIANNETLFIENNIVVAVQGKNHQTLAIAIEKQIAELFF